MPLAGFKSVSVLAVNEYTLDSYLAFDTFPCLANFAGALGYAVWTSHLLAFLTIDKHRRVTSGGVLEGEEDFLAVVHQPFGATFVFAVLARLEFLADFIQGTARGAANVAMAFAHGAP